MADSAVRPPPPEYLIDLWFQLRDGMFFKNDGANASGLRPPSLRDAAYAYAMSMQVGLLEPEMVEAFVNGLEIGAMSMLKSAWDKRAK